MPRVAGRTTVEVRKADVPRLHKLRYEVQDIAGGGHVSTSELIHRMLDVMESEAELLAGKDCDK